MRHKLWQYGRQRTHAISADTVAAKALTTARRKWGEVWVALGLHVSHSVSTADDLSGSTSHSFVPQRLKG